MSQLIRLASNLVLTRLLAPDMFGVMSVGYMVVTALALFSDLGVLGSTIQNKRGEEPLFLNVTWIVQIVRGILLCVAMLAISGAISLPALRAMLPNDSVYTDPRIPGLLMALSLLPLISGFESTKLFLAQRHLALSLIIKIDLGSQLLSTVVILVWAWVAPSVWALAFGWVVGTLVKTAMTHLAMPGPANRFEWDAAVFREIFQFGKWAMVSSSLTWMLTNGDRLLLGSLVDAHVMGLYSIAFMLVYALQAGLLRLGGHALLPALSEVARERPDELRGTLYRGRSALDFVCLVSAGALLMLGDSIVGLLYDSRYREAGWMLSTLSLTLIATRLNIFDQALIATGRMKLLSKLNAIRIISLYVLIPLGYHWFGTRGAVSAVAASSLVNSMASLAIQARVGLLDLRREFLSVPLFVGGVGLGWIGSRIAGMLW